MKRLEGQLAIVTGAASAIGSATCTRLSDEGASVVLAVPKLDGEARKLGDSLSTESLVLECDVTDETAVASLVEESLNRFGRIDLLVNNAGVMGAPGWQDADRSRPVDWDVTFAVNVKGSFLCADAVAPHMKQRRAGSIVNLASIAGRIGSPAYPHYHGSKAAVINLTWCLAHQLAPYEVRVNAVSPALVWSQMTHDTYEWLRTHAGAPGENARETFLAAVKRRAPMGREVEADDIAAAIAFLASADAKSMTGQTVEVNCGAVMV